MLLSGKQAVITGGGRGIGKAVALALSKEGCRALLVSRTIRELEDTKAEIQTAGGDAEIFVLDLAETDAPQLLGEAIENVFPDGVDILVTAAGIYGPIGFVGNIDAVEWKRTLDVNLFGTFAAVQAAIPGMQKRGGGKIITFGGGGEGAYPRFSSYVASKGGVVRLTETLAKELAEYHIDINAIAPGAVNTKFLEELLAAGPEKAGEEAYRKSLAQKEEGGVSPEKAAKLVLFLVSPESNGITGKVISALHDNYKNFPKHKDKIMNSDVYTFRRIKPKDRGYQWN